MAVTDFDTKVAVVVREDLATWQRLNLTAFLMSGITPRRRGRDRRYRDADGREYLCRCSSSRSSSSRPTAPSCTPLASAPSAEASTSRSTPPTPRRGVLAGRDKSRLCGF